MPDSAKVVAIAFDLNFRHASEIYAGASEYVREARCDWQLLPLNFGFEAQLMELARSGSLDGAIGTFVSDRWVLGLRELGLAAVNLFHFSEIHSVPTVSADDREIGKRAALHLCAQGCHRFAFFGNPGMYATGLRQTGFRDAIKGQPLQIIRESEPLQPQLRRLAAWSEPAGVYCTSDRLARRLINAAREAGLGVGRGLLVLGTDNDPTQALFANLSISSIPLPARRIGYAAAKRLGECFSRPTAPPNQILIEPPELIPRESTLPDVPSRIAQRAAALLRNQLDDPNLDIAAVAATVGTSRRALEIAFREQFGTSPYRFLSERRLDRARHLLRRTRQPVAEVGRHCGYPEPHHFSAWFRKRTGSAPKRFRG